MAIVQTPDEFAPMAARAGVLKERGEDILVIDSAVPLTDRDDLVAACNAVSLYDEKADDLIAQGVTFGV